MNAKGIKNLNIKNLKMGFKKTLNDPYWITMSNTILYFFMIIGLAIASIGLYQNESWGFFIFVIALLLFQVLTFFRNIQQIKNIVKQQEQLKEFDKDMEKLMEGEKRIKRQ
jgi:hypothetical protein